MRTNFDRQMMLPLLVIALLGFSTAPGFYALLYSNSLIVLNIKVYKLGKFKSTSGLVS